MYVVSYPNTLMRLLWPLLTLSGIAPYVEYYCIDAPSIHVLGMRAGPSVTRVEGT